MTEGTVKTINERRFGFIRDADGVEYFFHADDVAQTGVTFDDLRPGMRVQFTGRDDPKGPRAAMVSAIQ